MEIDLSDNDLIPTQSFGNKAPKNVIDSEHSKEYFSTERQFNKDPEALKLSSDLSMSLSFADDDNIEYPRGRDLIKDCPFCYTPTRKWIANIKQFDSYLFIFLILWLPYVSRFTFQTSYLHYTDSEPSLRSKTQNVLIYLLGLTFGLLMCISEMLNGIKVLLDDFGKNVDYGYSQVFNRASFHRGARVLHTTRSGFPLWTTKNNLLATKRPVSLLKWVYSLTLSEYFIHTIVVSRWVAAASVFIGASFYISIASVILARGINDSLHYVTIIHFINGLTLPLVLVYFVKFLYKYITFGIKSAFVKREGIKFEDPLPTRNGKTLLKRPIFAFLSDNCPCTYAVDVNSTLPKSYKYSIRYHCVVNGFNKAIFVIEIGTFTLYTIGTIIHSLFSKIHYRTISR
ncbi:hypothetical protein MACK_001616 [Theileria orientalis]|uniref:Uncharacterized protein n=1 Tax=Theileria orientalis TaxID=68886 RepID=A0A976QUV8_THEOR|nr:hypothetical protein MACK_001616 [Theileria orientalis]